MTAATGRRIRWTDLPADVRDAVEAILGAPVAEAVPQPGGFSPGTADRVLTADGRRAFVKAAGADLNPDTPELHRRELAVTAVLPASAPAPRLLGGFDDGRWVALVLEDIEGEHPLFPWRAGQLDTAMRTLTTLAETCTPAPHIDVPERPAVLADDFAGWVRLRSEPSPDLDPWAAEHLDLLVDLSAAGLAASAGETLVHGDVRADNLLLRAGGSMTLVDWPWAARGAAWVDTLELLVNVELGRSLEVDALLAGNPLTAAADADAVSGYLAGLTGYFLDRARRPPAPGLPTVRAFQRAQGDATLRWLRRRLG